MKSSFTRWLWTCWFKPNSSIPHLLCFFVFNFKITFLHQRWRRASEAPSCYRHMSVVWSTLSSEGSQAFLWADDSTADRHLMVTSQLCVQRLVFLWNRHHWPESSSTSVHHCSPRLLELVGRQTCFVRQHNSVSCLLAGNQLSLRGILSCCSRFDPKRHISCCFNELEDSGGLHPMLCMESR